MFNKKFKAIEVLFNNLSHGILAYFGIYAVVNASSYVELGLAAFATTWALIGVIDWFVKMVLIPAAKAIANENK